MGLCVFYKLILIDFDVILTLNDYFEEFLEFVRPEVESLLVGRNEAVFKADELKTTVRLAIHKTGSILADLKLKAE